MLFEKNATFAHVLISSMDYFLFRYTPLVKILLHYGCDPTAEDDTGYFFQKLSFLHQLTQNMTSDLHRNYILCKLNTGIWTPDFEQKLADNMYLKCTQDVISMQIWYFGFNWYKLVLLTKDNLYRSECPPLRSKTWK